MSTTYAFRAHFQHTGHMVLAYESRTILVCLTQAEMIRSNQHEH